jgi:hypothetical protein
MKSALATALLAASLAGCGTAIVPRPVQPVAPRVFEADPVDAQATAIIADLAAAWKGLKGMTATSETTLYQHGKVLQTKTVDVSFTAPRHCEFDVTAGEGVGGHLSWDGGNTAHASLGWWGTDLPLTSPQLAGPYGWTLKDTGPGMVVHMLAAPGVKARVKGPEKTFTVLEVVSPASPAKITREELAVDTQRNFVAERRLYADDELLGRIKVKAYKPS